MYDHHILGKKNRSNGRSDQQGELRIPISKKQMKRYLGVLKTHIDRQQQTIGKLKHAIEKGQTVIDAQRTIIAGERSRTRVRFVIMLMMMGVSAFMAYSCAGGENQVVLRYRESYEKLLRNNDEWHKANQALKNENDRLHKLLSAKD